MEKTWFRFQLELEYSLCFQIACKNVLKSSEMCNGECVVLLYERKIYLRIVFKDDYLMCKKIIIDDRSKRKSTSKYILREKRKLN